MAGRLVGQKVKDRDQNIRPPLSTLSSLCTSLNGPEAMRGEQ